jgi:hypothetical protein
LLFIDIFNTKQPINICITVDIKYASKLLSMRSARHLSSWLAGNIRTVL